MMVSVCLHVAAVTRHTSHSVSRGVTAASPQWRLTPGAMETSIKCIKYTLFLFNLLFTVSSENIKQFLTYLYIENFGRPLLFYFFKTPC